MAVKLYLTGVQKIIGGFIMSKIYSLEDAKKLISDFVEEEYGNEKVDFSDLSSIDVAYTTCLLYTSPSPRD